MVRQSLQKGLWKKFLILEVMIISLRRDKVVDV
jgi:hypothetical protein